MRNLIAISFVFVYLHADLTFAQPAQPVCRNASDWKVSSSGCNFAAPWFKKEIKSPCLKCVGNKPAYPFGCAYIPQLGVLGLYASLPSPNLLNAVTSDSSPSAASLRRALH